MSPCVSIETPERAHDMEGRPEGEGGDGSGGRPDTDDVVVVCPRESYERLRTELDDWPEHRRGEYEREYEDLLAERARLADEVNRLERRLESKKSQLDAVVARNERILKARTESYRQRIADGSDGSDDFEWTGRKQATGLLARVREWLR